MNKSRWIAHNPSIYRGLTGVPWIRSAHSWCHFKWLHHSSHFEHLVLSSQSPRIGCHWMMNGITIPHHFHTLPKAGVMSLRHLGIARITPRLWDDATKSQCVVSSRSLGVIFAMVYYYQLACVLPLLSHIGSCLKTHWHLTSSPSKKHVKSVLKCVGAAYMLPLYPS